ncbi:MAG: PTS sugar transporter subunit IIC [Candidatus Latescibacter sp.]|nr:PTS sugar transporter subunit IIC [Candidatus Latescibacter sp.]
METFLLLLLLGGIVSMDTTSGPQVMVSEPLVSCSLLGILLGMPVIGLLMGIVFQLLWFDYMPLGAVRLTDNNMASFISTASLLTAAKVYGFDNTIVRAALLPAMLFGIAVGFSGLYMTVFIRKRNGMRSEEIVSGLERGERPSLGMKHVFGIGTCFLKGVLMALVFVPVGAYLCGLVRHLPFKAVHVLVVGSYIIWGTVAASALHFYWQYNKKRYFLIGSIGGFLWLLVNVI